jgi:hypothetical protein
LNLEDSYDAEAVSAISDGLGNEGTAERKTLLVRISPISTDGPEVARARVIEALERGADGVVSPHVRNPEEAALAVSFFTDAGADVWSPANPTGTTIAMIMVEDADALADVQTIADVPGFSLLACGIGSLTRALNGDREAAEAGNQEVLAHTVRIGVPDMITANSNDVARRIEEGFLGLPMNGDRADEAIRIGLAAAGALEPRHDGPAEGQALGGRDGRAQPAAFTPTRSASTIRGICASGVQHRATLTAPSMGTT